MISNQELDRRWALTRAAMERNGLDWLVGATGHPFGHVRWLTGRTGFAGTLAAIPLNGNVVLASHGDEVHHRPHDSHGITHFSSCAQANIKSDNQVPILLDSIRATNPKRIGFLGMGYLSASAYEAFRKAFPNVEFTDQSELIAPLKAVKSEEELTYMRRAAALHDAGVDVIRKTAKPGIKARDVMEEVRYMLFRSGSASQTLMAGSAPPGTICKYAYGGDRIMEPGDQFAMLIEASEQEGYYSEAMPTVCLGKIPPDLQRVFDDVVEAQQVLVDMLKPGVLPIELMEANDRFMDRKGYPRETRLLGHAQGVDLVERPALSPLGDNLPIQENMIVSLHPTTHGANAWGYPVNMSFLVTKTGSQRMLSTPQEIIVL
jgi:Xaa-Pro aminopeptidase